MGFDLYDAMTGEHGYQRNSFTWRALHELIREMRVIPEPTITSMGFNDGALVTQSQARQLADRMKVYRDSFNLGEFVLEVKGRSRILPQNIADLDDINELIQFCETCNGFNVC